MSMQKVGGYSAIAWVCLMILLIAVVLPFAVNHGLTEQGAGLDPSKVMAAYSSSPATIYFASILEILLSVLAFLLVLGLYERMHGKAPNLTRIMIIAASASCALSIIRIMIGFRVLALMAQAADISIYKPILILQNGLEAASNNIDGWIFLLIGLSAISTKALPRFITYVFLVLGFLQVIGFMLAGSPGREGVIVVVIVIVIALILIAVSYIWLGVVMLKKPVASQTDPI